jgi:hypothetical protein
MNKYLFPLLGVILLTATCSAPVRIHSSKNLFRDISSEYDLREYNIVLKTGDSTLYLSHVTVLANGKIMAEANEKPMNAKKDMIFYTRSKSADVLEHLMDSSGNKTGDITFSKSGIRKVEIYNAGAQGADRHRIYIKGVDGRQLFIGVLVVLGVAALAFYLYLIWSILEWISYCYIATMVYGSYDAPEVKVLRKFRDEKLAPYFVGRIFIVFYYKLSPIFVRLFKNNKPFNKFIKYLLDAWVRKLMKKEMLRECD